MKIYVSDKDFEKLKNIAKEHDSSVILDSDGDAALLRAGMMKKESR